MTNELDESQTEAEQKRFQGLRDFLAKTGQLGGAPAHDTMSMSAGLSTSPAPPADDESGDFLIAPIPFMNPTIGAGLALGGAYFMPLGKDSPPSTIGAGALYSENGTFGGVLGFKGYFDEDRYRLSTGLAVVRLHYDISVDGIGDVPLRQEVAVFGFEFLTRVAERIFIGPQFLISGLDTELRREQDAGALPKEELEAESVALGLRTQRDTRDSTFYPRSGSLTDLQLRAFDEALGSKFSYQVLPIAYNGFFSPGKKDVVALRASARFAFGDTPFYGESFYGSNADLRGYTVGTLHDDMLLAAQAEYRRELFWRVGAVAFGGVGTVAPSLDELDDATALPSVGFGLRFTLEKENHVNFRLDFAWGRDQSAVYFGVGEAF